jgi:hypothetical protein
MSSQKFKFPFWGEQVKVKVTRTSILISQYIHFNNCQNSTNQYFNQQQQFGNYVPKYGKFERIVCQFKSLLLTLSPCIKTCQWLNTYTLLKEWAAKTSSLQTGKVQTLSHLMLNVATQKLENYPT